MLLVVALVLTLLGSLGVYGFFHLRGMIQEMAEEHTDAREAILAELEANRKSVESLNTMAAHLGAQLEGLNGRMDAHIDEVLVGPVSIRGSDIPAALVASTGGVAPPRSGTLARRP
jgi:hypothetical protein